jgi:hypothetical protein
MIHPDERPKRLRMTVIYRRRTTWQDDCSTGYAWYFSPNLVLKMVRPPAPRSVPAIARRMIARLEERGATEQVARFRAEFSRQTPNPDRVQTAKVILHEIWHCLGRSHAQMNREARHLMYKGDWRRHFQWANDLPLEARNGGTGSKEVPMK